MGARVERVGARMSGEEVQGLSSGVTRSRGRASPVRAARAPNRAASLGGVNVGGVHPLSGSGCGRWLYWYMLENIERESTV